MLTVFHRAKSIDRNDGKNLIIIFNDPVLVLIMKLFKSNKTKG